MAHTTESEITLKCSVYPNGCTPSTYKFTLAIHFDSGIVGWGQQQLNLLQDFPDQLARHLAALAQNKAENFILLNGKPISIQDITFDLSFLNCKPTGTDTIGSQIWKKMFPGFPDVKLATNARRNEQLQANLRLHPLFNRNIVPNRVTSILEGPDALAVKAGSPVPDSLSLNPLELHEQFLQHEYHSSQRERTESAMRTSLSRFSDASQSLNRKMQAVYESQGLVTTSYEKKKEETQVKWEDFFTAVSHLKHDISVQKFTGMMVDFEINRKILRDHLLPGPVGGDWNFVLQVNIDGMFYPQSHLAPLKKDALMLRSNLMLRQFLVSTSVKEKVIFQTRPGTRFYNKGYFNLNDAYSLVTTMGADGNEVVNKQGVFKASTYNFPAKLMSFDSDKIEQYTLPGGKKNTLALRKAVVESAFTVNNGISILADRWHDDFKDSDVVKDGLYENDVLKGQRLLVVGEKKVYALGERRTTLTWVDTNMRELPLSLSANSYVNNPAIKTDTTTVSAGYDENGDLQVEHLINNTLFTWIGQNTSMRPVFRNTKDDQQHYETPTADDDVTRYNEIVREFSFPFFKADQQEYPSNLGGFLQLKHQLIKETNPSLLFGNEYKFILANTYQNEWSPADQRGTGNELTIDEFIFYGGISPASLSHISQPIPFKRLDPVEPPYLVLEALNQAQRNKENKSLHELVLRSNYNTPPTSVDVRHIYPPRVNFHHAWWYGLFFYKNLQRRPHVLSRPNSYAWYTRFHEAGTSADEYFSLPDFSPDFIYPLPYLTDPAVEGFYLSVYFDETTPVIDPDRLGETSNRALGIAMKFPGNWPDCGPCKLIVDEGKNEYPQFTKEGDDTLRVRIKKGSRLIFKVQSKIRDQYKWLYHHLDMSANSTYGTLMRKVANKEALKRDIAGGFVETVTPFKQLFVTHAVKQPVVHPKLYTGEPMIYRNNATVPAEIPVYTTPTEKRRRDKTIKSDSEIILELPVYFEHLTPVYESTRLEIIKNKFRTGELAIYSTTQTYADDPKLWVDPQNAETFPTKPHVKFEPLEKFRLECIAIPKEDPISQASEIANWDSFKKYKSMIRFRFDVKETRFLEKKIIIRNKTSFANYFKQVKADDRSLTLDSQIKDIAIPNNRKPGKPVIQRIMPIFATRIGTTRIVQGNPSIEHQLSERTGSRFRIYLERGRLQSGKGEQLGVIVHHPDQVNAYSKYFQTTDQTSIVGRDLTTYSPDPYDHKYGKENPHVLLTPLNFNEQVLIPQVTAEPLFSNWKLVPNCGLMVTDPLFDPNQNLWYCDLQLDVTDQNKHQLYCPIIQLHLVHYQEQSMNYNLTMKRPGAEIDYDMRLSAVTKATLIYLFPDRVAYLRLTKSSAEFILSPLEQGSLKITRFRTDEEPVIRTKFFAAIQHGEGVLWEVEESSNENGEKGYFHQLEIPGPLDFTKQVSLKKNLTFPRDKDKKRRVILFEVEDYNYGNNGQIGVYKKADLLDNHKYRVVYFEENDTLDD